VMIERTKFAWEFICVRVCVSPPSGAQKELYTHSENPGLLGDA
jgi:hypothetical protein